MGGHLDARGITMRFEGVVANDAVDLEVQPSEIVGLIGPNGAGKTTFFNCVAGLLTPTEGAVWLNGEEVTGLGPAARAARGMIRTFQQVQLFGHLSVRENLLLGRHLHIGVPAWKFALSLPSARRAERDAVRFVEAIAEEFGLTEVLDERSGSLPYGTAKLVSAARALAAEPNLLMLDEPGAGMDTAESAQFSELLARGARERDLSVLLIEHDMAMVLGICDRVSVLDFGSLVTTGTPAQIRADDRVRRAYLGMEIEPSGQVTSDG